PLVVIRSRPPARPGGARRAAGRAGPPAVDAETPGRRRVAGHRAGGLDDLGGPRPRPLSRLASPTAPCEDVTLEHLIPLTQRLAFAARQMKKVGVVHTAGPFCGPHCLQPR